jgi:hypothetical protein
MIYIIRRLILAIISGSLILSPVAVSACGEYEHENMSGFFETPVSAKGRFVFVQRVSRRILKQMVAEHQQPIRPRLARAEI